jgi:hypothetical protein
MNHTQPLLDDWLILLEKHFNQRPLMKVRDVYKLLYQGILGPEHLIVSESAFAERLVAEYEGLTADYDDPLLEAIHPNKTLLRINLKPFKAAEYDLTRLLDACVQTAQRSWGNADKLRLVWEAFADSYDRLKVVVISANEMEEFTTWLASHDYPPVHHSPAYRLAYQPAYRLVAADLALQWK